MSLVRLRRRLQEMTESGAEPSRHRHLLAAISKEFPNTIQPLPSNIPENRYTCGMHVFEFSDDQNYIDVVMSALGISQIFAGPVFFEWLLTGQRLEEIAEAEA